MQTVSDYRPASGQYRGILMVLALHVLLAWLLISGTARRGMELLTQPMRAEVIQEVQLKPPPPKPLPPVPRQRAEPPPFIPEPQQTVAVPSTAPVVPSLPVVVHEPERPPAPPAPVAVQPPAPPAPVATKVDITVACPVQVQPDMPRRALRDRVQGVVSAQIHIVSGVVRDVTILSGPSVFHQVVRDAIMQYRCTSSTGEVLAQQDFRFSIQ
jgi:periplasmic protein TonB